MSEPTPRYADWKAPADDGQVLIWPEPAVLVDQTRANARRLSTAHQVMIQGIPLAELRRQAREFIGHVGDEPLIATGHQTELYHPGVWVKNAMINAVARKAGGSAFHFAVDTDAPKHLHLRWPGGSEPMTDDDRLTSAEWSGLLQSPSPSHLTEVESRFDTAAKQWTFTPSTPEFFASMRRLSLESGNFSADLTNSVHALEWDLGLRHHALVVSPLWQCEPYLIYVHHIMARCTAFATGYNRVLADYRVRNGVRTAARPMPDLRMSHDEIELPFWIDDLASGHRDRASMIRRGDCWVLHLQGRDAELCIDEAVEGRAAGPRLLRWCRENRVRVTPRALTLTMFFRLFLADQFVHGIGGARYDQVTDALIEEHFGLEAPRFSVTTATLYFPAAVGQRRINLYPLLQEGRRIRHGLLSGEKRKVVAQIDALPRGSRERQELFFQMHERLSRESDSPAVRRWEQELRDAEQASHLQKALFDRELFFAIQPRERLQGTIHKYDAAFA